MMRLLALTAALWACTSEEIQQPTCSIFEPKAVGIVAGKEDTSHDYVVKLTSYVGEKPHGTCTGTVIGPRHVLTASHCIGGTKMFVADTGGTVGRVEYAHVHHTLDIAILVTHLDLGIGPAKLPTRHVSWYFGCRLDTVGYGADYDSPKRGRKSARFDLWGVDYQGFLAADQHDSYVCYGDSGAPLLWGDTVIGVLFGGTVDADNKCISGWAFYVDAYYVIEWINAILEPNGG